MKIVPNGPTHGDVRTAINSNFGEIERSLSAGVLNQSTVGDWANDQQAPRYNAARYTEDLSWIYFTTVGNMLKSGQCQSALIDERPVLFQRVTSSNFYGAIGYNFSGASMTPFVTGQRYLMSFYVYADTEQWFWMRDLSSGSSNGHGPKRAKPKQITQVFTLVQATSATALDQMSNPVVSLGAGAGASPRLILQGAAPKLDLWIGGIQFCAVPSAYKDGIALIGDSTWAGSTGKIDQPRDFTVMDNREASVTLAADLNVPVFNRAVGGERLDQMDARWATDMTPLAVNAKYALIQGGINDIGQGRTLGQMQASLQSMRSKAIADGPIPRFVTVTPFANTESAGTARTLFDNYNAWLISTYGLASAGGAVIDIASIAADPANPGKLNGAAYGDGTHFSKTLASTIGEYVAAQPCWAFEAPTAYTRVDQQTIYSVGILDRSGSLVTGATSQKLMDANQARRGGFFQNISDADLWLNETVAAVQDQPSIRVAAGEKLNWRDWPFGVGQINIIGATTGKKFVARER